MSTARRPGLTSGAAPAAGPSRAARLDAARGAELAGRGQDADVPRPDAAATAKLRGQALARLRSEPPAWSRTLDECRQEGHDAAREALERGEIDPDLAGLRDPPRTPQGGHAERVRHHIDGCPTGVENADPRPDSPTPTAHSEVFP